MIIILILLSIICIVQSVFLYIFWKRQKNYDVYLRQFTGIILAVYKSLQEAKVTMDEADQRGGFKVDDEIGITFNYINDAIQNVFNFIDTYINPKIGNE